jgi:hypothetical protein
MRRIRCPILVVMLSEGVRGKYRCRWYWRAPFVKPDKYAPLRYPAHRRYGKHHSAESSEISSPEITVSCSAKYGQSACRAAMR